MKKASARWKKLLCLALLLPALALFGCEGDTGPAGPAGEPGLPGAAQPPATSVANESCVACHAADRIVDVAVMHSIAPATVLQATIDSVTFVDAAGNPVNFAAPPITEAFPRVTFTATIDGAPFVLNAPQVEGGPPGLTASNVRFGIAKLVPPAAGSGNASAWQSYVNRTETPSGAIGPGDPAQPVLASSIQATTESATAARLAQGAGPGQFVYTFGANLAAVTTPFAVAFEPNLTHRVAIQFSGLTDVANPALDFVPATGATVTPPGREIALTATCNECHDKLALHGGGRIEIRYCVVCHNPGSPADVAANPAAANYNLDAQSGNSIDMKVMIHKIHRGHNLPSVIGGTPYIIWGNRESEHNFGLIGYPQDIRHCDKCHDTGLGADGGNWRTVPTMATCTSCHDNISFVDPSPAGLVLHSGGVQPNNASCTLCHTPTAPGLSPIADRHTIFAETAAADFQFNIDGTTFDPATRVLTVNFSVADPLPGAGVVNPASGTNWDILADAPFTQTGASLGILVGWPTNEHTNVGSGNTPAQPLSINALTTAVSNGDGTFRVTATIPAGFDAVRVGIQGRAAITNPRTGEVERVPLTNTFADANTGAAPVARRDVVDMAKCNNCHGNLSLHGGNRQGSIEVCVLCHNPDATDINRRPAPGTTLDLKKEETIDFKRMIHAIHGAAKRLDGIVVYGFGGTPHDFGVDSNTGDAVHYPAILNNCEKCHLPGTFVPPLDDEVLATTVDTGADPADPADDFNITRTAAVCSSCHDQATMIGHMELQGANFSIQQENIIE